MMINPWVIEHLDKYIINHIDYRDRNSFKKYVLKILTERNEDWPDVNWSILYGNFLQDK